jgi:RNA recognition motif-containing protein
MARIIYDKPKVVKPGMNEEGISRGYGFVSVLDPKDCARAIREMDQSWLGSRPIKVKRSKILFCGKIEFSGSRPIASHKNGGKKLQPAPVPVTLL